MLRFYSGNKEFKVFLAAFGAAIGLYAGEDSTTSSTPPSNTWTGSTGESSTGEIGMIPSAEFEAIYYHQGTPALVAVSQQPGPL